MQHIVICEKQSYLTASLEREFLDSPETTFRWFPYLNDFISYLQKHDCDLAILNCYKFDQQHLQSLAQIADRTCVLTIAPADDSAFEYLLRELGMTSVLPEQIHFCKLLTTIKTLLSNR